MASASAVTVVLFRRAICDSVSPLATTPDRVMFVVNWKDRQDFTLDFSSPHNDKYGSTISVPAFLKGDFDGDGTRDVPAYR